MKYILIILLISTSAWAQLILPFDDELSDRIRKGFMVDGEFSSEKIDRVRRRIQQRKEELSETIRNYEFLHEREEYHEVVEKIDEEQAIIGFNMMLTYLNQMEASNDLNVQKRLAWKILELDFSSKVEGNELVMNNVFRYLKELLTDYEIYRDRKPKGEAKNLYDPSRDTYYSPDEIDELVEQGFDISKLNPSPKSHFWYDKDIKNSDVEKTFFGETPLYRGLNMIFPKNGKGYYKKVKKSQTKPKVHFTIEHKGEKYKFKLKFGAELASEITAGALIANLGFHHDMSKYVQDFDLILPEDMSYLDFKREWLEYYKKYDPEDYIKEIKEKDGRVVIRFREALIEAKPDEIQRLGPWAWGDHQELREVRGLLLFNMWIANNDIKEAGNNKLVLRYNEEKKEYDIYQFIHDLGFSFGRFSHEKPGDFPWTLVQYYDENVIDFKYYNFQRSSGFDHVTYYDGKWMVRKIAQLSRKQIEEAVKIGGWPKEVRLLYVEKLIARRNQLVKAFALEEEYGLIEFDRNISTANGVLQNGHLTQSRFDGYSQNFGGEIQTFLEPVYENLDYLASQAIIKSASAFDTLVFDAREFGYDGDMVSEIQLTMDRDVRRNEVINGNDDNYIVLDTLRVRFGLGVGVVLRGKVNYYKEYKLLYPVKTKRETGFDNKYILKAMMPNLIAGEELPENYVLLMEDGIEGEGELLVGTQHIPVSIGLSYAIGKLSRTIISKKLDEFTIYQDASVYKGFYARLYAELLVMRIPVWQYSNVSGVLGRYVYTVDLSSGNKEAKIFALEDMLRSGNLKWVQKFGTQKHIESQFSLARNDFDIFFIEHEYRRRIDDMQVYENNDPLSVQNVYQVDVERHSEWQFFGNGEVKDRRYRLYGEVDPDGKMSNVLLDMRLFIEDTNATTQEFENAYLPMYNQLSMLKRFFNFTPNLHSINQVWHGLEVKINLSYNKEALDKLLATDDQVYFETMAKYSNRDANFWATRVDNNNIDSNSRFIRNKFHHWMKSLRAARAARSDRERYTILTDAFSNLVWKLSEGYQCLLLGRIHSILGRDMFYMEGMIRQSEDVENTMPANTPLYNVMNPDIKKQYNLFEFDYRELEEIWELFQK